MKRSLCSTEPAIIRAHQKNIWKFHYTPATALPAKTTLCFATLSRNFEEEWKVPEKSTDVILSYGPSSTNPKITVDDEGYISYHFTLPKDVPAGETVTIQLGKDEKSATYAQSFTQRKRQFLLFVDPKGKQEYKDPEVFHIDVRGSMLKTIQIIAPSIVQKNQRFDVYLRFEDQFKNVTGLAPEDTLIELSYDRLRENLNWKLFVPETGFLTLPNLYFNEPGVYRLKLTNLATKEVFTSPPIYCFLDYPFSLFWGLFRDDPIRRNLEKDTEAALRYYRDDVGLQFFSSSTAEMDPVSVDRWKQISTQISEFNEEERFVAFLGFQYVGDDKTEGVRQIIYAKDQRPLMRKKDTKYNSLKKVYKSHSPKELVSIPLVSTLKDHSFNFEHFDPEFERCVEIFSASGSTECAKKEGNDFPLSSIKKGVSENKDGYIRSALLEGHRFGFVAGGFDRKGIFGELHHGCQLIYSSGLTAILSAQYSRDDLFSALYSRRVYATTGDKILIDLRIAELPIGMEISTQIKPGLTYNRHIHGFVAGTSEIEAIEIIRNSKIWKTIKPHSDFYEISIDDDEPLAQAVITTKNRELPFVYYYIKVVQKNGHEAWTSPIWIDYVEKPAKKSTKKK